MNSIKYKISITAVLGIVLLWGCSKSYLTLAPADSVPSATALGTVSGLQNALNGAYAQLRGYQLYGRDFLAIGDVESDNVFVQAKNTGRYTTQYSYTFTSSDGVFGEMWSNAYEAIQEVNQIIDAPTTGVGVDSIKAQAYGIRALMYFKLVNIYAEPYTQDSSALGVPLVLHYNPYDLPARSSVGTVYNQIVSDLKAAFQNAPPYNSSVTLSKYAAEALLARAYLYEGDYTDAESAAVDVINNSGFSLVTPANYLAFWADAAAQSDQTEVMFEIDADPINNNSTNDIAGIYYQGYQDLYCSSQLYDLYTPTDCRRLVIDSGTTATGAFAYVVEKFPNYLNADRDNLKVIRLAEVYLIAAEAALPSSQATALTYLNGLMAQRDPATVYASSGAQLLSDIVTERRKELAFEGDRFYDMNRLQLPINRVANPGAMLAGTNNANLSIPWPDALRVGPIPLSEILVNPNIASQQNPGY
jgi:hypothetical protein